MSSIKTEDAVAKGQQMRLAKQRWVSVGARKVVKAVTPPFLLVNRINYCFPWNLNTLFHGHGNNNSVSQC
jgi:hypothetical protein